MVRRGRRMERKQGCRAVWRGVVAPESRERPVLRVARRCQGCVEKRGRRREPGAAGETEG
ncbi:hypothetical protein FMUBM48_40110 [Nocardia cyriacigeorgica]|nr:hypothetical protein FMUBM48_40110 [Nocardia cyriacigeorgica]